MQINLEWKKIHNTTSFKGRATANEIIFLYPETQYINSSLINAFDKSDFRQLTLSTIISNLINKI